MRRQRIPVYTPEKRDEVFALEDDLGELSEATRQEIAILSSGLLKQIKRLPDHMPRPMYQFPPPFSWRLLQIASMPIDPGNDTPKIPGFFTIKPIAVETHTFKFERARRIPSYLAPAVKLHFMDHLIGEQSTDYAQHAGISTSGMATYHLAEEHTSTTIEDHRGLAFDELRKRNAANHANALGVASLVGVGVAAALDLDADALNLAQLDPIFADWQAEAGIIDMVGSDTSNVSTQHTKPIYMRTTIPHLSRL